MKGALFARYSRSAKSLRRLFLDEFVGDLDISGDHGVDATVGLARAEQLYDRVFFEYGDDSVAQLGGVHLACEQASNVLTKVLEWGRLMSYMEKSTRYVAYDSRLPNGRYRYYRDPAILDSPLGARYVGDMDRLFDAYAELLAGDASVLLGPPPEASDRLGLRVAPVRSGPRRSTPSGACFPRRRPPISGSTPAARPTKPSSCACGPTRCPRPGPTRDLMLDRAAQGHPLVGQAGRRPRPGGRLVGDTSRRTTDSMQDLADAMFGADPDRRPDRPHREATPR